jgi:hypothetical protein
VKNTKEITTDPHAYLVTDSEGNIMGLGPTEANAIEDAAKALEMEPEDVERITDEVARDGYQGDEETLILQTRQVWEEIALKTVEEYLGQAPRKI